MPPVSREILTAIRDALRASHTYHNLSTSGSTPRVVVADAVLSPPISPPYVYLSPPSIAVSYESIALGYYRVECRSEIVALAASDGLDTEARTWDAIELADDIVEAIQDAHADPSNTTLYNIPELLVQITDILGAGVADGLEYSTVIGYVSWVTHLQRGV